MLKSLRIRYDDREDRLLVLVETGGADGSMQAFHLTRRLCRAWSGVLAEKVAVTAGIPAGVPAPTRAALASGHHQALATQAKVATEPMQPLSIPRPLLVVAIETAADPVSGQWTIRLATDTKTLTTLSLSAPTFHGFLAALNERIAQSQWDLPAIVPRSTIVEAPDSKSLH